MTLAEAQIALTDIYPNYELEVTWRFWTTGVEYKVRWRPEVALGSASQASLGAVDLSMVEALTSIVRQAKEWRASNPDAAPPKSPDGLESA